MSFGEMMEILQIKNKGKIVICNAGEFYLATGKDAVLLKELIGLKLTCLKPEICKVGFPIASLEKYLEKIQVKQYSYIVYYFNQQKEDLEVIAEYNGKKINEYRMKLRDKGKRKLKKKVKHLKQEIKKGKLTSKEAKKYLAGHMGYIKYANTNNLLEKIFYIEN